MFEYDMTVGALRERQIVSALPPDFDPEQEPHAFDLHLTPDGRFLYASEGISHTLAAFKVDPVSGALTCAGSFATEKKPRGFNIDPYGRYLLAVGVDSHSMTSYAIDRESGNLTKLKQYPMGKNPNWVEIVRLP
jgi:6-phosphogluconolactonase